MTATADRLPFAGIHFSTRSAEDILALDAPGTECLVTVNAQIIGLANKNPTLRQAINGMTPVVDGQIVLWAINRRAARSNLRFEKISGSDFIYDCMRVAGDRQLKVALIGGQAAVNAQAAQRLASTYGTAVVGFSPPMVSYPFPQDWVESILDFLAEHRPAMVFFAFGAPKQELLMASQTPALSAVGCRLAVGCGGTLDFVSGKVQRAPRWVSRIGLEGVYRLLAEPSLLRLTRLWDSLVAIRYFTR